MYFVGQSDNKNWASSQLHPKAPNRKMVDEIIGGYRGYRMIVMIAGFKTVWFGHDFFVWGFIVGCVAESTHVQGLGPMGIYSQKVWPF